MSVKVDNTVNKITVETNNTSVNIAEENPKITIQSNGDQGPTGPQGDQGIPGEGVPTGGTARQALTKIDGTDYNTEFKSNWFDYSTNVEYTGVETAIAAGTVYTCSIDGGTIYRFVNSTNNANGYPIEDSFYTNFDGTNLTNLIATRG